MQGDGADGGHRSRCSFTNLESMEAWVKMSESDIVRIHNGDTAVGRTWIATPTRRFGGKRPTLRIRLPDATSKSHGELSGANTYNSREL